MAEEAARVVFVSGPSGAGRSTAIRALEDLGFEAIDNLPLSLLPRLLEGPPITRPLALGTDPRNRDFSAQALIAAVDRLAADPEILADLVFLDCAAEVLERRYSETRRRHPLAPEDQPMLGIRLEQDLLAPVRARAGILIDTSEMTPHDLRAEINRWFASGGQQKLALSVQSFSYKRGLPTGADLVFDCRFLRNPYWRDDLRALDGRDPAVAAYIADDPRFPAFADQVTQLIETLLPAYRDEGKSHLNVAFGCTGGQHRSVAMAENLAAHLARAGWQVSKRHRELERRGVIQTP
ncbi:RNase adapter RapZ [Rhodophyticola porphyridii]|uniref:RNase adapter RapZ n=1 Tax=Rhodophyticola porphyridii TaxID=1852017 RepID=A0A3L9XVY2_9RHOB|nr:RNase adapter RapZ [Rhodophyticola porphyridii]RMA40774.1 RNase adapter RapZ [Rhodophyticola porphyridii]